MLQGATCTVVRLAAEPLLAGWPGFVEVVRQVLVPGEAGGVIHADMAFSEKMQTEVKDPQPKWVNNMACAVVYVVSCKVPLLQELWKKQIHPEQPRSRPVVKLDRQSRSQADALTMLALAPRHAVAIT